MYKRVDYDPITKVDQSVEVHPDGSFTIGDEQDIEPVLQRNLDLRNEFGKRAPWKGDVHLVASIPNVIWAQMIRDGRAFDPEAIRKWCNDPANQMFRTRPGKV